MKKLVLLLMVLTGYALRAQTTGDLLTTFTTPGTGFTTNNGYSPAILDAAIQGDNKILLAGSFYAYNGVMANNLIRLLPNGTKDPYFNFNYTVNGQINKVAVHSDGKIYIAGTFNSIGGNYRNGIAQLNHNGGLNFTSDFSGSGPNSTIWAMALQSDGKILIGGNFTEYNGTATNKIVRLNTDGSLDTSFNVSTTDYYHYTNDIVVQPDGKILVAHATNYSDPSSTRGVVRLNTDGSLDTTFSAPVFNARPTAISLQSDGKLVVGGEFTQIGTQNYPYVARLNADGSLDTTFTVGSGPLGATPASENIKDIQVTSDDKILIGGAFTSYNGVSSNRIARLNTDGSLDTNFDTGTGAGPGIYDRVNVVQEDLSGQYYIGGTFTQYNGVPRSCVAKVYGNLDNNLTYIPDDNFEQRLIDLAYDDVLDDYVLTNNISGLTNLDINYKYISDLTGIEDFIALEYFTLDYNNITDLDLSANTQLINLSFRNNTALNTVNITQSTHIKYIDFSETNLTTIDVSQNTELLGLLLINNDQLTTLDLTQNTQLTYLNCFTNNISSLDLSQNTALVELQCQYNNLTTLDVSNNLQLEYLYCLGNNLTSLDVSQNLNLRLLNCFENNLTNLDLNQNTLLKYFYCQDNELTSLSIQNGNNYNLSYFDATGNSGLTCIAVDDVTFFTTNFASSIDSGASYSSDCTPPQPTTYVPDDNFEQALIDLGYDDVLDDYVITANISGVTSLSIQSKGISDLTGIEDFIALQTLYCNSNSISTLDLSSNTALVTLTCFYNQISSLNVSNCTSLATLVAFGNQLTTLDVSNNPNLLHLQCYNNQITSLDVSANTQLLYVRCQNNALTSLNVQNGNNSNFSDFNALNNPNLLCIQVDNVTYSTTNWLNKDSIAVYSTDCSGDFTAPTVITQNITVTLSSSGQATITAADINNGSYDDVAIQTMTLDVTDFTCADIGTNTVTLTVEDTTGNIATATALVTVQDTTAPVIPTLADVTGECSATATAPTTTDNCMGVITGTTTTTFPITTIGTTVVTWTFDDGNSNMVTANQNVIVTDTTAPVIPTLADVTGECMATATAPTTTDNCMGTITGTTTSVFPITTIGTTVVTWTFDDGNGNMVTANQNVIVTDTMAPVIPTLADVTGECMATATLPTTTDNCMGTITGTTTTVFPITTIGTTVVTWTFDDGNGNMVTANQNVIVTDTTAPVIPTLADVTGECSATATLPTTTDNCMGTITGTTTTVFPITTIGTTVVTWTFDDGNGNMVTANQNVIVTDTTAPVIPTLADVTGECMATATAPTTTDNCMGVITGTTTTTFPITTIGTTIVTWTFDDGNGNMVTANQNVIVTDTTAPIIPTLADVTGECMATATAPTTTDNCMGTITGTTTTVFPITTIGTTVVTWTFDDGNGNIVTANQNVIVTDTTAPVIPTLADVTGECSATATAPTTTDNCMGTITGTTTTVFPITTIGTTIVTWTFDDGNGNIVTANQNVIVTDTVDPIAMGTAIEVDLNGTSSVSILPEDIDNGSYDLCSAILLSLDVDTFTAIGTYDVLLTVTDTAGNIATVLVVVTVIDSTMAIEEVKETVKLKVYPVPANSYLNIESNMPVTTMQLIDTRGRLIATYTNPGTRIDVSAIAAGMYTLRCTINEHSVVKKIVIE